MPDLDCLIIGGGPAGLTAALYLARFGRRFLLADAGDSRAAWIPVSHNLPMFADGMNGERLLAMMRGHLARYDVAPQPGEVTGLTRDAGGFTAAFQRRDGASETVRASSVLLATGARDCPPALPALEEAVGRGLIRYCPICDGYEARGKTVAVLGGGEGGPGQGDGSGRGAAAHGMAEALFLARSFGTRVTLLSLGQPLALSAEEQARAQSAGIAVVPAPVADLKVEADCLACVCDGDAECRRFDTAYVALGLKVRSGLAVSLGAEHDSKGALIVDAHAETTVPGLFAAGDVTAGLDQIVVAMGQAAAAATAVHNRCPSPSLLAPA